MDRSVRVAFDAWCSEVVAIGHQVCASFPGWVSNDRSGMRVPRSAIADLESFLLGEQAFSRTLRTATVAAARTMPRCKELLREFVELYGDDSEVLTLLFARVSRTFTDSGTEYLWIRNCEVASAFLRVAFCDAALLDSSPELQEQLRPRVVDACIHGILTHVYPQWRPLYYTWVLSPFGVASRYVAGADQVSSLIADIPELQLATRLNKIFFQYVVLGEIAAFAFLTSKFVSDACLPVVRSYVQQVALLHVVRAAEALVAELRSCCFGGHGVRPHNAVALIHNGIVLYLDKLAGARYGENHGAVPRCIIRGAPRLEDLDSKRFAKEGDFPWRDFARMLHRMGLGAEPADLPSPRLNLLEVYFPDSLFDSAAEGEALRSEAECFYKDHGMDGQCGSVLAADYLIRATELVLGPAEALVACGSWFVALSTTSTSPLQSLEDGASGPGAELINMSLDDLLDFERAIKQSGFGRGV